MKRVLFGGLCAVAGAAVVGLISPAGRGASEPPAPKSELHSLESMPVQQVRDDPNCQTFDRSGAKADDAVLRVLGESPKEPVGEMLKPQSPTTAPIETVRVLHNGDVLFGENAGIQRQPFGPEQTLRSDPSHCSPIDFWWDAQNRKLHVRSLEVTENGDAPEIGIRRSGDGTYPNGPPLPSAKGQNLGIIFWMGWANPGGFDNRAAQISVRAAEEITSHASGGNMYLATTPIGSTASPIDRVIINNDGKVGIGVDPPQAQCHVMGTTATGMAEDYVSNEPLEAGDVVCIVDSPGVLAIRKSTKPYEKTVVGVVAGDPAIRISQDKGGLRKHHGVDPHDVPVAAAGRTLVKVSTENGAITAGDFLTSSSAPGVAMKATNSGDVLGKALQSYSDSSTGKIFVSLNLTEIAVQK